MTDKSKQQLLIWWVLWGGFQVGIFIIYFVLRGATPQTPSAPGASATWLAALGPVFVSVIIRWIILPRVQRPEAALQFFVIGIALAEGTCLLGLFLFPAHKLELFVLSAFGILQFLPVFARRFF